MWIEPRLVIRVVSYFINVIHLPIDIAKGQRTIQLPTGKGFADIVLLPNRNVDKPAVVLELKFNHSADTAIAQIKEQRYAGMLLDHVGNVLLVGINYDKKTKHHECIIERLSQKVDQKSGPEKWTGTKLNERQEAIVEWISNHPNTTYDEMSERFGVSRQTIYKDTKKLQALGVIIREGEDFGGIWRRVT